MFDVDVRYLVFDPLIFDVRRDVDTRKTLA